MNILNLTEVIVRAEDTLETLKAKVELATILGTIQSSLTNFNFLSHDWVKNTKEESLLGVSLTGIMDHSVMSGKNPQTLKTWLNTLRDYAIEVNSKWANYLQINPSASITCVKPSGTVSSLVNSASGIHTRHSHYYIRTVRADKKDPLYHFMKDQGIYCEDDVMKPDTGAVFYFPIKAPNNSIVRSDISALEHLELWLIYQNEWCMHKPSITISVKEHEWMDVGAWVWKHFDQISGISFLPYSDHTYQQAPYQEITEEQYNKWLSKYPVLEIDWTGLVNYEKEDTTVSSQTLACTGSVCEIL